MLIKLVKLTFLNFLFHIFTFQINDNAFVYIIRNLIMFNL